MTISQIVLHAINLEFKSASLNIAATRKIMVNNVSDFKANKNDETVTLVLDQSVDANLKGVLSIQFTGFLNDKMTGFYRSTYKDANGNTKNLATTQFGPTSARRAFPCFDEPKLKATFSVTLVVPESLTALSNMDVKESISESDGLKRVKFNKSPLMSTYLLAFVVGEFDYVEAFTSGEFNDHPIKCRVYTLPGEKEKGRFSLDIATRALEFYAREFGISYPLPKLDQVAIHDFEFGAMEN